MTDESKLVLRGNKCAHIILQLHELFGIPINEATDIFYKSENAKLIESGISDLQCRSDKYLASLIWEEYQENFATKD